MPQSSPSTPPEPYSILFEPVRIGPLVARNRFFQVPHCNGMGYRDPSAQAALRKVKAEGGWAVVCTEQAEIHPIAAAVWSGRRFAEEFDADRPGNDGVPFRREVTRC